MAETSTIEWTAATWNPVTGCSVVSPGCTNCYAMRLAGTRLAQHPSRAGLTRATKAGPVWNGEVRLNEQWLAQPLSWRRPRMIFVCAHGDLFHEAVPDEWIDRVFAVMALAPQHTFQVLTKRAERIRRYMADVTLSGPNPDSRHPRIWRTYKELGGKWDDFPNLPLPNVWLGVSAEDQKRFDERVADLYNTPAVVRFFSFEPMLGAIDARGPLSTGAFHWAIVGGESQAGARPMHPDWARSIRDQCADAGVPFFFKQWGLHFPAGQTLADGTVFRAEGENGMRAHKSLAGRFLDGVEHNAMPEIRR